MHFTLFNDGWIWKDRGGPVVGCCERRERDTHNNTCSTLHIVCCYSLTAKEKKNVTSRLVFWVRSVGCLI
jgi:hypothetical protein